MVQHRLVDAELGPPLRCLGEHPGCGERAHPADVGTPGQVQGAAHRPGAHQAGVIEGRAHCLHRPGLRAQCHRHQGPGQILPLHTTEVTDHIGRVVERVPHQSLATMRAALNSVVVKVVTLLGWGGPIISVSRCRGSGAQIPCCKPPRGGSISAIRAQRPESRRFAVGAVFDAAGTGPRPHPHIEL